MKFQTLSGSSKMLSAAKTYHDISLLLSGSKNPVLIPYLNFSLPIFSVLKMLSAYYVCCIYSDALQISSFMRADTMNPDQTV